MSTCTTARWVHLELVSGFHADKLLLCLKRSIRRKRKPNLFVSDNFNTLKSKEIKTLILNRQFKWGFMLGDGFYERLINTIKKKSKIFRKVIFQLWRNERSFNWYWANTKFATVKRIYRTIAPKKLWHYFTCFMFKMLVQKIWIVTQWMIAAILSNYKKVMQCWKRFWNISITDSLTNILIHYSKDIVTTERTRVVNSSYK